MKKTAAALLATCLLVPASAGAAQTQLNIQTTIDNAFSWLETNAQPLSSAGSSSSDYYIMALSRMGRDYRYSGYVDATSSITPSTSQDAQRLIMANAACGEVLSDSFVGAYTYNADLNTAADIAGAIITLVSGGYEVNSEYTNIENMIGTLLTRQQSNGSFENDVITTAKAVIALSNRRGDEFILQGTADNEEYTYSVNSAVDNALSYLSGAQQADGGYSTMSATAYTVIALDSVGADAQNDGRFIKNGITPIDYIYSHASGDGSFSSSPDDTAMAACALVSHLRYMQGKASFFNFYSGDSVDTVTEQTDPDTTSPVSGDTQSGTASGNTQSAGTPSATQAPAQSTPGTIRITPPPTREPEHSAMDVEEYGPQQFVGPIRQSEEPKGSGSGEGGTSDRVSSAIVIAALVATGILIILSAAAAVLYRVKPEYFEKLKSHVTETPIGKKIFRSNRSDSDEKNDSNGENDLLSELDKSHDVVPTDELYDPDFIKKLIPVDEIDSSIDSLIPKDSPGSETDPTDDDKNDSKNDL